MKQRPFTVAELDRAEKSARLTEKSFEFVGGSACAAGGAAYEFECPPLLTGGVHPEIPARGVVIEDVKGGYIVISDDGPKMVPLQRPIQGERCVIDYATFTFDERAIHRLSQAKPFTDMEIAEATADYMQDAIFGKKLELFPAGGMNGYRISIKSDLVMVACGGNNSSVMVCVYGFAFASCDEGMPKRLAQLIEAVPSAHLTRLDIAYDDFSGEIFSPWKVRQAWDEGQYSASNSPVKAKLEFRGDYERKDPDGMGVTAYVGSKGSGKLIRIYEKGKQLGDSKSKWVRAEVELSNSIYQLVPEMLIRPTSYFIMLCPAFAKVSYQGKAVKAERQGREAIVTVEKVVDTIKVQYGTYLHTLRKEFFGSDQELLDAVCRIGKVPKVLQRAIHLSDAVLTAGTETINEAGTMEHSK